VNGDLEASPGTINEDPAGRGWFMKIRLNDPSEVEGLMSEEQYLDFVKSIG
jgi:glycine cleavage system H protein